MIGSPFQAKFTGPYRVKKHMYLVYTPERRKKVQWCHVNPLKPYYSVHSTSREKDDSLSTGSLSAGSVRSIATEDCDVPSGPILTGRLNNSEYLNHLGRHSMTMT